RVAARCGCVGQLGPGVLPITVQVQGSAHEHDPAVTAVFSTQSTKIFVFDVVGEGNCRLARVGFGFGADFQFPVHHDPLGGEFRSLLSAKLSLPLIVKPFSGCGLTSRTTFMPLSMVTTASLPGTFLSDQVAASDQRPPLTAEELAC